MTGLLLDSIEVVDAMEKDIGEDSLRRLLIRTAVSAKIAKL